MSTILPTVETRALTLGICQASIWYRDKYLCGVDAR